MEPLEADPELGELIDEHGVLELEPADDEFQRLVVSIINQQLSVASAAAIRERVEEQFELTPEAMVAADREALVETGLSRQKVTYIEHVAEAFQTRELRRPALQDHSNEEIIDALTAIHGIGPWTAEMYLIFVMGREDVFPIGDLGIRNAMAELYGHETRGEMTSYAARWKPYRSLASLYLWRVVD